MLILTIKILFYLRSNSVPLKLRASIPLDWIQLKPVEGKPNSLLLSVIYKESENKLENTGEVKSLYLFAYSDKQYHCFVIFIISFLYVCTLYIS